MIKRQAQDDSASDAPEKKQKQGTQSAPVDPLESAYREALAAFKKDKTNKDLRRVKSAARKAWDEALASSHQDGEQIQCRDCSQTFIFSAEDQEFYAKQNWEHKPIRCKKCSEARKARRLNRRKRDSKGRNICFAFKRGECEHGDQCKFSHWVASEELGVDEAEATP